MLIIYDMDDYSHTGGFQQFMDREIINIQYVRTDAFDKSENQKWIKSEDGKATGNGVYNHYVPHSRIIDRIIDQITGKTRRNAMIWLGQRIETLHIQPDEIFVKILKKIDVAAMARADYDARMSWMIESIADWPKNMFLGKGTGDHGGTALDKPHDQDQHDRVAEAGNELFKALGVSLADEIKKEEYMVSSAKESKLLAYLESFDFTKLDMGSFYYTRSRAQQNHQ